jgi:hypothetical protein
MTLLLGLVRVMGSSPLGITGPSCRAGVGTHDVGLYSGRGLGRRAARLRPRTTAGLTFLAVFPAIYRCTRSGANRQTVSNSDNFARKRKIDHGFLLGRPASIYHPLVRTQSVQGPRPRAAVYKGTTTLELAACDRSNERSDGRPIRN